MAVSVTRSQLNSILMEDSGVAPKKHQMMEFLVEEWYRNPPIEFQTLVESIPRCIEAFLAHGGPTRY